MGNFTKTTVFKSDDSEFMKCIENLKSIKSLRKNINKMKVFLLYYLITYLNGSDNLFKW